MACFPFSYNGKLLAAPGHEYQGACRSRWVPKIRRRRYLRLSKVNPLNPQPMSIAFLAWKKKRKKCEHSNAFYIYIYVQYISIVPTRIKPQMMGPLINASEISHKRQKFLAQILQTLN